jgi:hypothetical protein
MEEVPVLTEAITAAFDRLWILPSIGKLKSVGYLLDYLITRTVRSDLPAVAAARKRERQ